MGGSSEQTVGYKIYEGRHLALCKGPIDKIFWIKTDNKVAWSDTSTGGRITIDSPDLYGGESREGGISGDVDFEQGLSTQGQNDYLLSVLGTSLLPAFRRICALVLRKIYIGLNPYPKPMLIRGQRIYVKGEGEEQWYPEKAAIGEPDATESYAFNTSDTDYVYTPPESFPPNSAFRITTDDRSKTIRISLTSGGWSPWLTDIEGPEDGAWTGSLHVSIDGGEPFDVQTKTTDTRIYFESSELVFENFGSHLVSGGLVYDFFIKDDPTGDNRGIVTYKFETIPALDINPSHAVRELFNDQDFGLGLSADEDINDDQMTAVADTLYDEGMGVSFMYLNTTSVNDMVQEVLRHVDGVTVVDNETGKIGIKLLRDDYDTESLVSLSPSNCTVSNFTRVPQSELINEVTVQYWDSVAGTDKTVTVQNIALMQSSGEPNPTKIEYPWFTNSNVAARAAARDLRTLGYPRASCTVTANRIASQLAKGDVFNLSYPKYGIANMVMRITDIDYGDGIDNKIVINCTQDTFSLPEIAFVANSEVLWESSKTAPSAAESRIAVELPYLALVNRQGQDAVDTFLTNYPEAGYVGSTAERPGGSEINARLWTDAGGGYVEYGKVDFCPTAELSAAIGLPDGSSTETWGLTNSVHADIVNVGTWGQVDDELVAIVAASSTSITVIRAVLDTLPEEHAAGSKILFWGEYAASDEQQYELNDEVNVKLQTVSSSGVLPIADSPVDTVAINSRAIRPYPPANVKMNGLYWPDDPGYAISLTWAHRDRVQQTAGTFIDWFSSSIGPENGTTYTATWYLDEEQVSQETGITGTAASYTYESSGTGRIELKSVRDGYDSYRPYSHEFIVDVGFTLWTPAEISTTLWLDASDSDTVTISTGVSAWADKSGNGNDGAQAITSRQPTYNDPYISFGGDDGIIVTDNSSLQFGTGDFAVFAVVNITNTLRGGGVGNALVSKGDPAFELSNPGIAVDGGPGIRGTMASTHAVKSGLSNSTWAIVAEHRISSSAVANVNGADGTPVTISSSVSGAGVNVAIGCRPAYDSNVFLTGSIGEVIILPSGFTSYDVDTVIGYLAWKWDGLLEQTTLVDALPTEHTFKSSAPMI